MSSTFSFTVEAPSVPFTFDSPLPSNDSSSSSHSSSTRASVKSVSVGSVLTLKRHEASASLRKDKRQEHLSKRRRADGLAEASATPTPLFDITQLTTELKEALNAATQGKDTSKLRADIIKKMRTLFAQEHTPLEQAAQAGTIQYIIQELSRGDSLGDSLIDGVWSLSNLACGSDELTSSIVPAIPLLISMLDSPVTILQEQAVWCLGNMAAEDRQLRVKLVQSGIVPHLLKVWNHHMKDSLQTAQQIVQKISQNAVIFEQITNNNQSSSSSSSSSSASPSPSSASSSSILPFSPLHPLPILTPLPSDASSVALLRVIAWCFSNLVKGCDHPQVAQAFSSAPVLVALLPHICSIDQNISIEVTWTLATWASLDKHSLQTMIYADVFQFIFSRILALQAATKFKQQDAALSQAIQATLSASCPFLHIPVAEFMFVEEKKDSSGLPYDPLSASLLPLVRLLGQICHGPDIWIISALQSTPMVIQHLLFSTLYRSLHSLHRGLKKETCWVLSNLCAIQDERLIIAIIEAGFVPSLLHVFIHSAFDIQREVAYVIYNFSRHTETKFMPLLFPTISSQTEATLKDVMSSLFNLLRSRDPDACWIGLRIMELILRRHPQGVAMIEKWDGIDAIETIQTFMEDAKLVDYAKGLVNEFFGNEEEDETQDEKQQPEYPAWRLHQQ